MLPAIISQCVVALKDTSLGYAIGAPGLTHVGKQIYSEFQNQVQTLIVVTVLYVVVNLLLTWLATLGAAEVRRRAEAARARGVRAGRRRHRPEQIALTGRALQVLPGRHPEPDDALDHDGPVVARALDPHRQVGVVPTSTARGRSRRCR